MIIRSLCRSASATLIATSLLLTWYPDPAYAAKNGPKVTSNQFDNALENVFYFDDSDVILGYDKETGNVFRSPDAGETWKRVEGQGQVDNAWDLWSHPWDNKRAYIIGLAREHWVTDDQGESWRKFDSKSSPDIFRNTPMNFHGRDPKKVVWNGEICEGLTCDQAAYYTDDDFVTVKLLGRGTRGCQWAVGSPQFAEEIDVEIEDRIFCILEGLYSQWTKDQRLLVSDDYFNEHQVEPELDDGRTVSGIISMAAVKKYLVAAAKSEDTDELALFVTDDASQWHRCEFGQHRIEEDAYTILESTNYSMQVDVLGSKPSNPMGYLFTSNSNGTYFTRNIDHTNRNIHGRVDFEKISNIQGIVLVNTVDNWKKVEASTLAEKNIVSKISFDDGRTFQDLKAGDEKLHLHSVTDAKQGGRIFSSPAPGIVMGIGNTGKYLRPYEDGDLFVSNDAGATWAKRRDGAHLYEFGNQGAVIMAVDDEEPTSQIIYSIDHGKTWEKADLGMKIRARFLTTAPDSTTLKFLLMGTHGTGSKLEWHVFKIDFEGLHERFCGNNEFERWPARVDENGKPSCIMGHKQFYRRRKADAKCVIKGEFKDPVPEFEPCTCTQDDFECDYNFVRDPEDRSKCNPVDRIKAPEGKCKNEKDTFKGPSGWRLIPGNECKRKGGEDLDQEIERPCSDAISKPITGEVGVEKTNFDADRFAEWYYLEKGGHVDANDETIVMRTTEQDIYLTTDHGRTWEKILKGEPITSIVPNPNNHDTVMFLTGSKKVHYTIDRASTFRTFDAPEPPSTDVSALRFHPETKEWFLWAGSVGRDDHTNFYYTTDRGDDWKTLLRYTKKCDFIPKAGSGKADQLIYCEQYEDENPDTHKINLLSSDNWFADRTVHFPDILDFATMSEFIIVAAKTEDQEGLKVDASVDGHVFAPAEFPKNFHVEYQQAYTVLDSSTHAVFLHVTVQPSTDRQYGTIIKSNSNGTSYVMTINAVNRDNDGYVDFEKMLGLEGVAMVNVVDNVKGADGGEKKRLKSMITHNDGAEWALIPPPKEDALGGKYSCVDQANKAGPKCSLHLHSYTERDDKSATFSSPSAVGVMLAVGNVGEYLARKDDDATDTFITRDAGITWKSVKKGSYMWEYGDQGSIIVIVKEHTPTKSIFYTLDEGEHWQEFEFTRTEMQIDAITTVPSDRSMNFLLWGSEVGKSGIYTVALDFSSLEDRQRACKLDEKHPVNEDYDLWSPKHPLQDSNCLFGHVSQYHRKRLDAKCYNGKNPIPHLHSLERNCTCTRQDFECDYNYEAKSDGTCVLVSGYSPPSHLENCQKNPEQVEFWYPTGYRRIPLTTCEGGQELDKITSRPCPGHEKEYAKKHGLSGAALFFVILIPICVAIGVGYWMYTQWESGFGNFGQIRLGDGSTGSGQSPLIAIPVAIVSGVVAVIKAVPLLFMSLFRSAKGYVPIGGGSGGGRFGGGASGPYRSRDSFANRQQDYSTVAEDDAMLGDGLDDEEAEV